MTIARESGCNISWWYPLLRSSFEKNRTIVELVYEVFPVVCSTDRSKPVVPVLVLLFVALWFILRGDLLYVFPCVILFLCFLVLLALRLPRLGKRELILVLFVRLFDLCLFGFVGFLLPLGVWEGLRFVIEALPGLFSYLFFHHWVLIYSSPFHKFVWYPQIDAGSYHIGL